MKERHINYIYLFLVKIGSGHTDRTGFNIHTPKKKGGEKGKNILLFIKMQIRTIRMTIIITIISPEHLHTNTV